MYEQHLDEICDMILEKTVGSSSSAAEPKRLLNGTFAFIEILGAVGERAGIDNKLITVDEASVAIDSYLKAWVAETGVDHSPDWTWKNVVYGTSATQAKKLLSVISEDSQVVFARDFRLTHKHEDVVSEIKLMPSWTLGWYLHHVA